MKKQIAMAFAGAALVVLGACGTSPTGSATAVAGRIQADQMGAPSSRDTTQRVPNMMGSGN